MILVNTLQDTCVPSRQLNLIFQSRMVWRDLATWIRAYLVSVYANFSNLDAVREKLNQVILEFSNIFSLIFGDQLANEYVKLISDSIDILESLISAQIEGDTNAINSYTEMLYDNANERAAFLSKINPFWSESEWKNLLFQFNQLTIDESNTFLNKEYTKNIDIFDRILNLTSKMGDYYSEGLLNYLTFSNK